MAGQGNASGPRRCQGTLAFRSRKQVDPLLLGAAKEHMIPCEAPCTVGWR